MTTNPKMFAERFLAIYSAAGLIPAVIPVKKCLVFHKIPVEITCEIMRFTTKAYEKVFNRLCSPRFWKMPYFKNKRKADYEEYSKRRCTTTPLGAEVHEKRVVVVVIVVWTK